MTDFLIIGSPRSGGTLVNKILCSDPGVHPFLMENHFVAQAVSMFDYSRARLELERGHFFSDEADVKAFFAEWVAAFLDKVRSSHAPTRHLIIKSVLSSRWAPLLNDILPDIRFIITVRDPRDVITSMIDVGERQERDGRKNQYQRNAEQLSQKFMSYYAPTFQCRTQQFLDKLLVVRYEDIVTAPQETVAFIQAATGIDLSGFDPSVPLPSNARDADKSGRFGKGYYATGLASKGITDSSVGRYKEKLTLEEMQTIERICAPLMQAFRYAGGL